MAGLVDTPAPQDRPGGGVDNIDELARIIALVRDQESRSGSARREVTIGEFNVDAARVPRSRLAALQNLSRTEAAVLRFLGWGRSNTDIATLLNINENTVRTHMNNAIRKLDVDGSRGLNSIAGLLFHPVE